MNSLPNSSLEAGLAALKKGDYPSAIAYLEEICAIELDQTTILRAQMALVAAYDRSGNRQKAIALCQKLTNSSNNQVKQWAVQTLTSLTDSSPTATDITPSSVKTTANNTGFVPLDQPPAKSALPPNSSGTFTHQSNANNTGFTPPTADVIPPEKREEKELRSESLNLHSVPRKSNESPVNRNQKKQTSSLSQTSQSPFSPTAWKQAGRLPRLQPLPASVGFKPEAIKLWVVQIVTAIALFYLLRFILPYSASITNNLLVKLPFLEPIQPLYGFYYQPTVPILIGLAILLVLSPWLLDGLLKLFYGLKRLPIETLANHSPEASRILQRISRERRLPLPSLGVLPTAAPVTLTYGNLPHTARIVISQGLLDQLTDDEIATIYASEFGHIIRWDFVLMSLGALMTQLPYIVYWKVSVWGEQWEGFILRGTAGAIAALSYGLYWLLRWPWVWLSRLRIYYSDRFSVEVTGNPNGLTRALLKIAIGIAQDIEQQKQTSWLLESFEILMPLGDQEALTLGSLYHHTALEPILAGDYLNSDRRWLALNNFHPLIGDRLQLLAAYARYWKLETELNLTPSNQKSKIKNQKSKLLLQVAPYLGILIGVILGALIWLTGGIGSLMRIRFLSWLLDDYWWFLLGFVLTGFSIGTLLRINAFFPDIKPSTRTDELTLPDLLTDPTNLPILGPPIRLQGRLLGRPGISNWLGQDLILQSHTGLVKLHFLSWLGPIGNLFFQSNRPSNFVNQSLSVTGWFRRGATPWIDAETLRTQGGKLSQSNHPIWSTIIAFVAALGAAYIIFPGGL